MKKDYIENLRNFVIEQNKMFVYDINYKITQDIEEGVDYALSMLPKEERDILIAVHNGIPDSTISKKFKISLHDVRSRREKAINELRTYRYCILFGKQGAEEKVAEDAQRREEWIKSNTPVNTDTYLDPRDIRFKDIDSDKISVRLFNCMSRTHIENLGMAAECNVDNVRNLGKSGRWELYCLLTSFGIVPVWKAQEVTKKGSSSETQQIVVPEEIIAASEKYIELETEALQLRKRIMDWKKEAQVTNQNCDWYKEWRAECQNRNLR